jgi:hypothetical protein
MKYIILFIALICTIHGLAVHALPLNEGKRLIIFIYNFYLSIFSHLTFSFVVLMKRCSPGAGLRDCNGTEPCTTSRDCMRGLYCELTVGYCVFS